MIRRLPIVLVLIALLAACGGQPTAPAPTSAPAAEATSAPAATNAPAASAVPAATSAPDAAAFPIEIEHKFGVTEITKAPERIVSVGLVEQDALLALGVTPVGTTEWFGGHPGAIWPWAQDELAALGGQTPEVIGTPGEESLEKIAALKPDVILALYSGVTQEQYDLLAQIAPVVAQPKEHVDYGVPWDELTRTVGAVVGKPDDAEQLIKDVEARFETIRAENPQFVGASAISAMAWEGIYVYGPQDARSRLLMSMGFTLPDGLAAITGDKFGANLSEEKADMLDTDVIIWIDPQDAQGSIGGPLYARLDVVKEGREVFLNSNEPLGGATSFISVLSLPYLLDGLVPKLTAAIDGDPKTEAQ